MNQTATKQYAVFSTYAMRKVIELRPISWQQAFSTDSLLRDINKWIRINYRF